MKVEVELYANKNIKNDFFAFYKEIEDDFEEYISKFKCEDEGNIEGFPKKFMMNYQKKKMGFYYSKSA